MSPRPGGRADHRACALGLPQARRGQEEGLGGRPSQRGAPDYLTDNGNAILDVDFPDGIEDPETLEQTLCATPGVVECGLFIGLADVCIVGHDDGTVEERRRDA